MRKNAPSSQEKRRPVNSVSSLEDVARGGFSSEVFVSKVGFLLFSFRSAIGLI